MRKSDMPITPRSHQEEVAKLTARQKIQKLAELAVNCSKVIDAERGFVRIVSHYDADGISSGTIMHKLMQFLNKEFEIVFVKQLEDETLQKLIAEKEHATLWIFTDLGSGHLNIVKKYLEHERVLIIDHHQPAVPPTGHEIIYEWPKLYHFNPYLVGIQGEDEISGSGMAYIIARTLSVRVKELIHIALIGAIGDMQKKSGSFKGINLLLQEDAEFQGLVKVQRGLRLFGRYTKPLHRSLEYSSDFYLDGFTGNESSCIQLLSNLGIKSKNPDGSWRTLSELSKQEEQKLATALILEGAPKEIIGKLYKLPNGLELGEFATILNACGRIGKPLKGLKFCLGEKIDLDAILSEYKASIGRDVNWYKSNKNSFKTTKRVTYIIAKDEIDDANLGVLLSIALRGGNIKTDAAFGFANASNGVKVSARTKDGAKGINLGAIIAKVTQEMTSNALKASGGGHKAAAGAKIPFNSEEVFIELVEEELSF